MQRTLVVLAALAALAACGRAEQKGYPADYEINFMRACEAQSDVAGLCACTWEGIEAQIDPDEFSALERLPGPERQSHPLTQQIEQITLACHASLTQAQPAEPTPEP